MLHPTNDRGVDRMQPQNTTAPTQNTTSRASRPAIRTAPPRPDSVPNQAVETQAAPAATGFSERLTKSASRTEEISTQNQPASGDKAESNQSDRTVRFMLQAAARQLLPSSRVAWCLRRVVPGRETVEVRYSEERQRAYYHGLATCKCLWECPVCASRISERRREKLAIGVDLAPRRLYLAMLTFTVSHHKGESFAAVHNRLKAAYKRFWGGRWAQGFKDRFGVVGTLRALEVTYGANGWHPHIHLLIVADRGFRRPTEFFGALTVADEITALVQSRWQDQVAKGGAFVFQDRGVDVQFDRAALADYVAKLESDQGWGLEAEVTKAVAKIGRGEHRSLTALLYDYAYHGDEDAGRLWIEAVTSLKGQRHLMASKGFWELLGQPEQTDGELAAEDVDPCDQLLAALTLYQWREICRLEVRGHLLEVAGRGDPVVLAAYLQSIGIAPESPLDGQGGAKHSKHVT